MTVVTLSCPAASAVLAAVDITAFFFFHFRYLVSSRHLTHIIGKVCVCWLCSAIPGEMMTNHWPSRCISFWSDGLCVGLCNCQYVYVSPAEFTCFSLVVCVRVCVWLTPSTSDVSFWMMVCASWRLLQHFCSGAASIVGLQNLRLRDSCEHVMVPDLVV